MGFDLSAPCPILDRSDASRDLPFVSSGIPDIPRLGGDLPALRRLDGRRPTRSGPAGDAPDASAARPGLAAGGRLCPELPLAVRGRGDDVRSVDRPLGLLDRAARGMAGPRRIGGDRAGL